MGTIEYASLSGSGVKTFLFNLTERVIMSEEERRNELNISHGSRHVYFWWGHTTCKCDKCGKVLRDEVAENDSTKCKADLPDLI